MLSLAIFNESQRVIQIHGYRLRMLWPEPNFHWLENPVGKVPRQYYYSYPQDGPKAFPLEIVLNHRVRGKAKLYPGDRLEGLLLGVGEAPIPDGYLDRQMLQSTVSVLEEQNRYNLNVQFAAGRLKKRTLRPRKESEREQSK